MAALGPAAAVPEAAVLLGMAAGASGLRFKAKPVVVAAAAVVVVAAEVVEAAPGGFRLKPSIPVPGVPAVVAGAQRESPEVVDEAGVVASEAKSVGPVVVVVVVVVVVAAAAAVVGVGAAGCVAPAPVATGVAGVKGSPGRAVGWAELPTEPMLKLEVPVWDVLPLVNEKPPGVVDGAAEVVVEPNTKPLGVEPWADVSALETALESVLPPSPKPLGCAGAGVAAALLLRFSFGVLRPKENPVPPAAGVVVPKLNPGACVVAEAWVVSENRLVEGVLEAGWEGVPKLNPPVPDVEKENAAGVVVAVFAAPNVNPPVGAPVPPKLNLLMAPDSGGSSYSGSQSNSTGVCNRACALRSCRLSSAEATAASSFRSHGVLHSRLGARLRPAE